MNHDSFDSAEAMAARCTELDAGGMEVWQAVASYAHPHDEVKGDNERWGRKKENVSKLRTYFLDIDVDPDKPGKAYATLEDAERALAEFVQAFGEPYHLIVHSGGGLHVYWLLDESVSRDQWDSIALKFKDAVRLAGLLADPSRTADAASLLRPVRTTNKKPKFGNDGRPVTGYRCRFGSVALEAFEAACDRLRDNGLGISGTAPPTGAVVTGVTAIPDHVPSWYEELPDKARKPTLRSMLASLPANQVNNRCDWLAVGMALACEGHLSRDVTFQLWAEWSQSTPEGVESWREESLEQQRRRFDGFNRSGIGALIARAYKAGWYADMLRDNTEDPAAHQAVVAAHAASGERWTIEQANAYLKDHVIYVSTENQYIHDGLLLCKESLDTSLARHMPRPSGRSVAASTLVKEGAAVFADYTDYRPGALRTFLDTNGRTVANTYSPHDVVPITPSPEDVRTFRDFLLHLASNNAETKEGLKSIFVKYAYLYKHPSERIRHATLLIGKTEGSGKSTLLLDMPRALFGNDNVRSVETREVSSDFNGYAQGHRILSISELWLGNRKDAQARANDLKPLITDNRVSVVRKGKDGRDIENVCTIFASSNYDDAAFFGAHDRRYHVISTEAPKVPQDLANRVHDLIKNRPGALLYLVLHYGMNGDGFDPNAPPPQTAAKRVMMEANRSEWAQWLNDKFQAREYPFVGDAVAVDDVKTAMGERFHPMPSDKVIRDELFNLADGAVSIQAQRKTKVGKTETKRVIVLRSIKKWQDAGISALYEHYEEAVIKKRPGLV
ncbi:hypothetical protein B0E47_10625 [Rhodanobacter sp. B05]|uniref:DUF5906 domain-containing protein n=1 Tax=Rhodanobacter sp. B05 TaxID=1945859 RepID=UPI0009D035A2|nr:DUF5906 domain-containing protein [Rhodanobacter sp. B05]OOG55229.1 hypothetical protein B0E47_10625 [Rhodanobacter sp. B05]